MSRKARRIKARNIESDIKYNSIEVQMFINKLMLKGKKSTASRILYDALDEASKKIKKTPLEVFNDAMKNVRPILEVRARRVGGATYQVPVEVRQDRSIDLAMRWIIGFSRARKGKAMYQKLAEEFISAAKNEGASVKKREDTHKMAEANRAFAHYRW